MSTVVYHNYYIKCPVKDTAGVNISALQRHDNAKKDTTRA